MAKHETIAQRLHLDRLGENYLWHRLCFTLAVMEHNYCWLPGSAPLRVDLHAQNTFWPLLHSVVIDLFMTEHRTFPHPYWKAYRWVNNLLPEFRLVRTVDRLVQRARARLNETGESYLLRLECDAVAGDPKASRLLKLLRAIMEDVSKAKGITWADYEQLLFKRDNKLVRLACGDLMGFR